MAPVLGPTSPRGALKVSPGCIRVQLSLYLATLCLCPRGCLCRGGSPGSGKAEVRTPSLGSGVPLVVAFLGPFFLPAGFLVHRWDLQPARCP